MSNYLETLDKVQHVPIKHLITQNYDHEASGTFLQFEGRDKPVGVRGQPRANRWTLEAIYGAGDHDLALSLVGLLKDAQVSADARLRLHTEGTTLDANQIIEVHGYSIDRRPGRILVIKFEAQEVHYDANTLSQNEARFIWSIAGWFGANADVERDPSVGFGDAAASLKIIATGSSNQQMGAGINFEDHGGMNNGNVSGTWKFSGYMRSNKPNIFIDFRDLVVGNTWHSETIPHTSPGEWQHFETTAVVPSDRALHRIRVYASSSAGGVAQSDEAWITDLRLEPIEQ